MSSLEVKFTALDCKGVEADGSFEGYASIFNHEDMGHDIILPGAFAESLATRGAAGIKLLFQHDANQPIGVWTRLEENARGLFAEGRLMRDPIEIGSPELAVPTGVSELLLPYRTPRL